MRTTSTIVMMLATVVVVTGMASGRELPPGSPAIKGYHLGMTVDEFAIFVTHDDMTKWEKKRCKPDKKRSDITICDVIFGAKDPETIAGFPLVELKAYFITGKMCLMTGLVMNQAFVPLSEAFTQKFGKPRKREDKYRNGFGTTLRPVHLQWDYVEGTLALDQKASSYFEIMSVDAATSSSLMWTLSQITLLDRKTTATILPQAKASDL